MTTTKYRATLIVDVSTLSTKTHTCNQIDRSSPCPHAWLQPVRRRKICRNDSFNWDHKVFIGPNPWNWSRWFWQTSFLHLGNLLRTRWIVRFRNTVESVSQRFQRFKISRIDRSSNVHKSPVSLSLFRSLAQGHYCRRFSDTHLTFYE